MDPLKLKYSKFVLVLSAFLCFGCFGVKPGTEKSANKNFESFYIGASTTQYFVKPLELHQENSKNSFIVDFTFRSNTEIMDTVIVNFSIISPELLPIVEEVTISNGQINPSIEKPNLLFREKNKSVYIARYTTLMRGDKLKSLFADANWQTKVTYPSEELIFQIDNKSNKKIKSIFDNLFILY